MDLYAKQEISYQAHETYLGCHGDINGKTVMAVLSYQKKVIHYGRAFWQEKLQIKGI